MKETKKPYMIACFSPKGGVGKTTISTQLAVSAKKTGAKVCFYDLDPQQSANHYFEMLGEKYRPDVILNNFEIAPPSDCTFIILDCAPNLDFIPPKSFTIVSPTLATRLDMHAYRRILEMENEGYNIIKVLNQFSFARKDDLQVKKSIDPCVVIGANSAIRHAMNNYKSVFNSNYPNGKKAKNQFLYLIKCIVNGKAEILDKDEINNIALFGNKEGE